jgi:hypothetical protein
MEGRASMKKKDNPQLETISFETISKVVDNCTTPKKQKPNYTSFSISIMDNNWDTNADKNGNLLPNKELVPIYLKNHPCEYAREIYKLGFKFCKWLNEDKQKYTVSLDGSYIPRD